MSVIAGPTEKREKERTLHNIVIPIVIGVISAVIMGTSATFLTMRVGLAVVEEKLYQIDYKAELNTERSVKLEAIVGQMAMFGEWRIGQDKFRDRVETYMANNEQWKTLLNTKTADRLTRSEYMVRETELRQLINKK